MDVPNREPRSPRLDHQAGRAACLLPLGENNLLWMRGDSAIEDLQVRETRWTLVMSSRFGKKERVFSSNSGTSRTAVKAIVDDVESVSMLRMRIVELCERLASVV